MKSSYSRSLEFFWQRNPTSSRCSDFLITFIWSITFFLFFAISKFLDWPIMRSNGERYRPDFFDLSTVLKGVECYKDIGFAVYSSSSESGCAFNYGSSLLIIFSKLGLGVRHTNLIGWLFICSVSIVFAILIVHIRKTSLYLQVVSILVLISPPVHFLLERGNIDILIFIITTAVGYCMYYGPKWLGVILAITASTFKFYSFPVLLLFYTKYRAVAAHVFLSVLVTITAVYMFVDLERIYSGFGIPGGFNFKFGNSVIARGLDSLDNITQGNSTIYKLIGFLFLALIYFALRIMPDSLVSGLHRYDARKEPSVWQVIQIPLLIAFLSCYFFSESNEYRLIFLIIPLLIFLSNHSFSRSTSIFLYTLTLLVFWFSLIPTSWLKIIQFISDFSLLFVIVILATYLVRLLLRLEYLSRVRI